jgi:putative oxidoreductase
MFRSLIATARDSAPTIARIMLGIVFFPHGAQKALGWYGGPGIEGTMGYLHGMMHIPVLFVWLAIAAEFLGSLGLIVGFLGRVAAFGIACNMAVAVATTHLANGFFMNWTGQQKGEGYEYHLLALTLAAIVIVRGSGAYSVDRALTERAAAPATVR